MSINWKVRVKSGAFWLGVISAITAAVFAILPLCGVELSITAEQVMRIATLILMIPASIGIISDPTTKGIGDSRQAMTYDEPRRDGVEK